MKRRDFIHHSLACGAGSTLPMILSGLGQKDEMTIRRIDLFRYDINIPRHFSWGTWFNRQQVFMKITASDYYGWAEIAGDTNNPDLDLEKWSGFLRPFIRQNISTVYESIKAQQFGTGREGVYDKRQMEFVEMALLDILGRHQIKPAIELLGMEGRNSLPGLFCILESDLDKIEEAIRQCQAQKFHSFVKFKMYGDENLDLSIAKLARAKLSQQSFILSDANRGYKQWSSIDQLAQKLNKLRKAGLNAMEDPAELTNEQWIDLQSKIGDLMLVPDYAMRPAWKGIDRAEPGMGRIYNIHPESMGSLNHLRALAAKINGFGGKIMIGDASFVGPACSVWQQIAIGVGAEWVEALEKKGESDDYLKCIISKPTSRQEDGNFGYLPTPGFGLEIDSKSLKEVCSQHIEIR